MRGIIYAIAICSSLILAVMGISSCKKGNIAEPNRVLQFHKTGYYPLEVASFNYSDGIDEINFNAVVANITCPVVKIDDTTAALYIPDIPGGTYELTTNIKGEKLIADILVLNKPNMANVGLYLTSIQQSNDQQVNEITSTINLMESGGVIDAGAYNDDVSALQNLNQEIATEINALNASDKQQLAEIIRANPLLFESDDSMTAYINRLLVDMPLFYKTNHTTLAGSDVLNMYNLAVDFSAFFFNVYRPAIAGLVVGTLLGLTPGGIAITALVATVFRNQIKARLLSLKIKLQLAWDLIINYKWYTDPIDGLIAEINGTQVAWLTINNLPHQHRSTLSNFIPGSPVTFSAQVKRRTLQLSDQNSPYNWLNNFLSLYNKSVLLWNNTGGTLFGTFSNNFQPVNYYKDFDIDERDYVTIQVTNNSWVNATMLSGSFPNFTLTFNNTSGSEQHFQYKIKYSDGIIQSETPVINGVVDADGSSIITDIEGNSYHTIQIGNQTWMQENLKTSHFSNGSLITDGRDSATWANVYSMESHQPLWCYTEDNPANNDVYGKLYNAFVAEDSRNVCPVGWHIPSRADYMELVNYLGGAAVAGGKMKTPGTDLWYAPNTDADNSSGFSGVPAGERYASFWQASHGYSAFFWTSEDSSSRHHYQALLSSSDATFRINHPWKEYGSSIRCIKD